MISPENPLEGDLQEAVGVAAVAAFLSCVERAEALVENETHLLRGSAPVDFEQSNLRKARAFVEFTRATRALPVKLPLKVAERLQALQMKLRENSLALEHHLRATVEIAELLVTAMRLEQSDGTYSHKGPSR